MRTYLIWIALSIPVIISDLIKQWYPIPWWIIVYFIIWILLTPFFIYKIIKEIQ